MQFTITWYKILLADEQLVCMFNIQNKRKLSWVALFGMSQYKVCSPARSYFCTTWTSQICLLWYLWTTTWILFFCSSKYFPQKQTSLQSVSNSIFHETIQKVLFAVPLKQRKSWYVYKWLKKKFKKSTCYLQWENMNY